MKQSMSLPKNPYCDYMRAVEAKHKQLELDFQKWIDSEANKQDMSGRMLYCLYCPYSDGKSKCGATQEVRQTECACAKAYKKLITERNI